jgi:hypothetical protein
MYLAVSAFDFVRLHLAKQSVINLEIKGVQTA